jgi:1-acyl-sn-glycerol-3-phosphate acyltransferase
MSSFEDEFRRLQGMILLLSHFALLGKKLIVRGEDNIVKSGPSIVVGNHCGSFKDVAAVLLSLPRPVFFTANKQVFTRGEMNYLIRKHLVRHLKGFGTLLNFLLGPLKSLLVTYITSHITRVGTIPVDLYNHGKREAIARCEEYLRAGRAIIALQGRGRVVPGDPNPYVKEFSRGTSIIAFNLNKSDRMDVPVTPLAMFGTQRPLVAPGRVLLNVGSPMFIRDYLRGGFEESVERFRQALEFSVNKLFFELIRS